MLPALLLIPMIGAFATIFLKAAQAKWVALGTSLIAFIVSIVAASSFEHWNDAGYGLTAQIPWLSEFGITLNMGVDSVALLLVLLTTILMPLCIWGSFTGVSERIKEYYGWLLVLEAAMIGVFIARDLIFFYTCFELTLVPMYILIAAYGSDPRTRSRTATKFFIYTFTGSLLTLAALIYVAWRYVAATPDASWTFDIATLVGFAASSLTGTEQFWIMLAMLIGFGVKVPLFPVHTWLPLAHTEAPTAGSVILAGVLLKLGTYGIYRFLLPMTPDAVAAYAPAIAVLAIIGIIYAALICWVQTDIKRLIAYSSVSHLGFCVMGLVALNPMGAQGSVLYMINHGLSTGALFFLIGMMYERYHTRDMERLGGLARVMPVWAFFMVFFVLASVGLPGLNGFVSEFLCLIAAFTATVPDSAAAVVAATDLALIQPYVNEAMQATQPMTVAGHLTDAQAVLDNAVVTYTSAQGELAGADYPGRLGPWYAAVAGLGMIFAAMYLLIMVGKVVFGPLKEPPAGNHHDAHHLPKDLTWREIGVLTPLAVLCLVLGFKPVIVTDAIEDSVEATLVAYPAAVNKVYTVDRLERMKQEVDRIRDRYQETLELASGTTAPDTLASGNHRPQSLLSPTSPSIEEPSDG